MAPRSSSAVVSQIESNILTGLMVPPSGRTRDAVRSLRVLHDLTRGPLVFEDAPLVHKAERGMLRGGGHAMPVERTHLFNFRISEDERAKLAALASDEDMPSSVLVRKWI